MPARNRARGLGWFAVEWVTMMAAMMLPSIVSMVLAQARVQIGATPAFVAEYPLTWAAVGMLGYALVEGTVAGPRRPRLGRGGTVRRGRRDPRRGLTVPGAEHAAAAPA